VPALQAHVGAQGKPVTGIFEASVAASLQLLQPGESFGIVSTGKVWEAILSEAVANLLGTDGSSGSGSGSGVASSRFAGVETTGLSATELHDVPAAEVREKMKAATKRLLRRGNVSVVCLGCAGMAGMNEMVREAAVEELGPDRGEKVRIVDGVQAGAAWLDGAVRMGF
jgi:Asp/Glu/hydantoin racemase